MISNHYTHHLISFFMALFMSCIMSAVITVFNIGFTSDLIVKWFSAWGFAFAAALPTIFIVGPLVRKLVMYIVNDE